MTKHKPKCTDDEIETQTIGRLGDPSAWEEPIYVPPLSGPRPLWMVRGRHFEIAAKFYVLYFLHLHGAEANLTIAQPDSVDITVVRGSGQAATTDVKALSGTYNWNIESFHARMHHYLAFVLFRDVGSDPSSSPLLHLIPSQPFEAFIRTHGVRTVAVDKVVDQLDVGNVWEQLVGGSAA